MSQGLIHFVHLSINLYILECVKNMSYGNIFHLYNVCEKLFFLSSEDSYDWELNSLLLTCWPWQRKARIILESWLHY